MTFGEVMLTPMDERLIEDFRLSELFLFSFAAVTFSGKKQNL
jgi:hypothetical protein